MAVNGEADEGIGAGAAAEGSFVPGGEAEGAGAATSQVGNGGDGASVRPRGFVAASVDTLREHPSVLIAVVGAVAYAYLRLFHIAVYRELGLSPEEVGLGYAETLGRGFGAILVIAVLLGVLFTVGVGAAADAYRRAALWTNEKRWWVFGAVVVAAFVASAIVRWRIGGYSLLATQEWDVESLAQLDEQTVALLLSLAVLAVTAAIVVGLIASVPPERGGQGQDQGEGERPGARPVPAALTVFVGIIGLIAALWVPPTYFAAVGRHVADGEVLPDTSAVVSLTGLVARPVEVLQPVGGQTIIGIPTKAVYLGAADGITVLLAPSDDPREGMIVWRLPSDEIILKAAVP